MRLFACFVALFLVLSEAQSQLQWSSPIQLTTGNSDDLHPSMVVSGFGFFPPTEWLAFSRGDTGSSSRNICLLKSSLFAQNWFDTLYHITNGSAQNDFPFAARTVVGNSENVMVVWQRNSQDSSGIWSRLYTDSSWGEPMLLGDGSMPVVTPSNTGFAAVWVSGNRVMFSSFDSIAWSSTEEVAFGGGLAVSLPQIQSVDLFAPSGRWLVVWQQEKSVAPGNEILYSERTDTGWTIPGVVSSDGDNRNPRFHKKFFPFSTSVSWESDGTGDWEIYTLTGDIYPDGFRWYPFPSNDSNNPNADDNNPSFQIVPIITQQGNVLSWYSAAAWVTTSGASDSIALRVRDDWYTQYSSPTPGTTDRNPDVSSGVESPLGVRVWVVWENNASGHWKLYGVYKDIVLDVAENQTAPNQFSLSQNYPNPFNPSTTISFITPHSSFITLKVYNVLGQEISVLVNEKMEAGEHNVVFNAEGLPSGVYIYRIQAGEYSASRKMVLIK